MLEPALYFLGWLIAEDGFCEAIGVIMSNFSKWITNGMHQKNQIIMKNNPMHVKAIEKGMSKRDSNPKS
jgi:hypothetical protein